MEKSVKTRAQFAKESRNTFLFVVVVMVVCIVLGIIIGYQAYGVIGLIFGWLIGAVIAVLILLIKANR